MKHLLKFLCFALLLFVVGNIANAQRTREFKSNNSNRSSGRSSGNNYSPTRSAPVRTFSSPSRTFNSNDLNNNSNRNITYRNDTRNSIRNTPADNRSTETMRYRPGNNSSERNVSRNSAYRGGNTIHNNYRYNNTSYRTSGYGYGNHYGNVYGRRTVFMYGPSYRVMPSSFISIHFGGNPYYYSRGYYYGYYSGYYQPIFPPFGLRIGVLPFGYSSIFVGLNPFYYYNGIYYRQYDHNSYEVVDAPMGATVSSLPQGARSVTVNGEKLYELNGTYYKADRDTNGNDIFSVVGKNGVINNMPDHENSLDAALPFQIGDTISQLPEGSKVVTINGRQLYETPDNIYLEQNSDNGVTQYKVVGK